ncbi:MarR family transcriptional regulator [Subtercola boreus]|uniref:MarR family transcriptional regulator n=1 Tax=Subtercola boreus TaxID=120213 RepID=A0A3E0VP42_9MICO|nr:MarR family transcriptional regulator [Subtercola boreus]RFA11491.1 MarR family transcriptional regulator [Subtercola boreus]
MPDESQPQHDSVGAWAKQYYFASRALIEATLREHGIGPTQWYVLHQLVNEGPTTQRELALALKIERATMSGVVSTLVRKGLVAQIPDAADQRQRILSITAVGRELWAGLPDPVARATALSFDGADPAELAVARHVLKEATERLLAHMAAEEAAG